MADEIKLQAFQNTVKELQQASHLPEAEQKAAASRAISNFINSSPGSASLKSKFAGFVSYAESVKPRGKKKDPTPSKLVDEVPGIEVAKSCSTSDKSSIDVLTGKTSKEKTVVKKLFADGSPKGIRAAISQELTNNKKEIDAALKEANQASKDPVFQEKMKELGIAPDAVTSLITQIDNGISELAKDTESTKMSEDSKKASSIQMQKLGNPFGSFASKLGIPGVVNVGDPIAPDSLKAKEIEAVSGFNFNQIADKNPFGSIGVAFGNILGAIASKTNNLPVQKDIGVSVPSKILGTSALPSIGELPSLPPGGGIPSLPSTGGLPKIANPAIPSGLPSLPSGTGLPSSPGSVSSFVTNPAGFEQQDIDDTLAKYENLGGASTEPEPVEDIVKPDGSTNIAKTVEKTEKVKAEPTVPVEDLNKTANRVDPDGFVYKTLHGSEFKLAVKMAGREINNVNVTWTGSAIDRSFKGAEDYNKKIIATKAKDPSLKNLPIHERASWAHIFINRDGTMQGTLPLDKFGKFTADSPIKVKANSTLSNGITIVVDAGHEVSFSEKNDTTYGPRSLTPEQQKTLSKALRVLSYYVPGITALGWDEITGIPALGIGLDMTAVMEQYRVGVGTSTYTADLPDKFSTTTKKPEENDDTIEEDWAKSRLLLESLINEKQRLSKSKSELGKEAMSHPSGSDERDKAIQELNNLSETRKKVDGEIDAELLKQKRLKDRAKTAGITLDETI